MEKRNVLIFLIGWLLIGDVIEERDDLTFILQDLEFFCSDLE